MRKMLRRFTSSHNRSLWETVRRLPSSNTFACKRTLMDAFYSRTRCIFDSRMHSETIVHMRRSNCSPIRRNCEPIQTTSNNPRTVPQPKTNDRDERATHSSELTSLFFSEINEKKTGLKKFASLLTRYKTVSGSMLLSRS